MLQMQEGQRINCVQRQSLMRISAVPSIILLLLAHPESLMIKKNVLLYTFNLKFTSIIDQESVCLWKLLSVLRATLQISSP